MLAPLKQRKTSESAQILRFKELENEHWLHVDKKSIMMKNSVPQWITLIRLGDGSLSFLGELPYQKTNL